MSITRILIGTDRSIAESLQDPGAPLDANVYVEAANGHVYITGPMDNWAGFEEVADFSDEDDGEEQAEALARAIAADPGVRLECLDYDTAYWFVPVPHAA